MTPRETLELVLFEIAGARYGADLAQVRFIGALDFVSEVGRPLGTPLHPRRALAFEFPPGVDGQLAVDAVLGVRTVDLLELRRMPPAAAAPRHLIGAWLDGEHPVLLVDLHALAQPHPENVHVH